MPLSRHLAAFWLLTGALACVAPPPPETGTSPGAGADARTAFFRELSTLCGQRFPGKAVFTSTPQDPMATAAMEMDVADCSPREIRVPFRVGNDRSRTWVITLADTGLLLKHDHRHADGTPDSVTNYGGWATTAGSATRQHFAADSFTAALIPAARTNVWTLEIDRAGRRFIYDLQREARPRFRAEFDMAR